MYPMLLCTPYAIVLDSITSYERPYKLARDSRPAVCPHLAPDPHRTQIRIFEYESREPRLQYPCPPPPPRPHTHSLPPTATDQIPAHASTNQLCSAKACACNSRAHRCTHTTHTAHAVQPRLVHGAREVRIPGSSAASVPCLHEHLCPAHAFKPTSMPDTAMKPGVYCVRLMCWYGACYRCPPFYGGPSATVLILNL